jgi:hypothetical protein
MGAETTVRGPAGSLDREAARQAVDHEEVDPSPPTKALHLTLLRSV